MLWLLLDRYNPSIQGNLSRLVMLGGIGKKKKGKRPSALFWYHRE